MLVTSSMSDDAESSVLLEKLEKHVQDRFPVMFLDFNEFGVSGIMLLEYARAIKTLYGEYSEMTPYIDHTLATFSSAILSSASIGGKMRNSFLIKKYVVGQFGNMAGQEQKKDGGLFGGFGDLFNRNKKNELSNTMDAMGR